MSFLKFQTDMEFDAITVKVSETINFDLIFFRSVL